MGIGYDGDTFSIIMIYDNRLKEAWGNLHSPINHFISRHDGMYSGGCGFIKDSAVTLCELWRLGKNGTYYEYHATETERNQYLSSLEMNTNTRK